MENLLLVILLFPLLGAGLNLLFGNKVGEKGIGWIANAAIGFSFLTALSHIFSAEVVRKALRFLCLNGFTLVKLTFLLVFTWTAYPGICVNHRHWIFNPFV
ncbi:MAG: hypothetical protein IPH94_08340 [Saprospiraceae bacterium]|nr:hypothetical protein [Saprospiraceae bacterium]